MAYVHSVLQSYLLSVFYVLGPVLGFTGFGTVLKYSILLHADFCF